MAKLKYLNVGCGHKYHSDWVNIDMGATAPEVINANLLAGFPFPDNSFEVVYHSQVVEHFPKEKAHDFIGECYRVLKPGGILRVVCPDLENIVDEYKKYLNQNLENPSQGSIANYNWIMLEMYDQTVRNQTGGLMRAFLEGPEFTNEQYVYDRIGHQTKIIQDGDGHLKTERPVFLSLAFIKKAIGFLKRNIQKALIPKSEEATIGRFRLGGEIHMWMYDRYSLGRLLKECGFKNCAVKNPTDSDIENWEKYELDVKDGVAFDPTSLFMEATK